MEREEALLTSIAVLTFTASRGSVHQVNLLGQFREMATPSTAESRVSCEMRSDQGARLIRPSSATYIGAGKEDSCNYKPFSTDCTSVSSRSSKLTTVAAAAL